MSEGDTNGLGDRPGLEGEGKERVGNRAQASSDHVGGDATAHGQGTATDALRALGSGFAVTAAPSHPPSSLTKLCSSSQPKTFLLQEAFLTARGEAVPLL